MAIVSWVTQIAAPKVLGKLELDLSSYFALRDLRLEKSLC